MMSIKPMIITSDAGGTMTDLFVVDPDGKFVIGKAATTPHDESIGYWESLKDAFSDWGIDLDAKAKEILPSTEISIYSGTTMLNAIVQHKGSKVGVLITKGFEDSFVAERGFQKIAGYSYADRLHAVTHMANPQFSPKKWMKGITERISVLGKEAIPLYEHEVYQAVRELVSDGVEVIGIVFLFSYVNPSHEQAAARIAHEVMAEMGRKVPVLLSCETAPVVRELSRLNSVMIEAYGAASARAQLFGIEKKLQDNGFRYPLQTLLSYGGLADIRYPRLFESMISGPVGGLLGAKFCAEKLGLNNVVTADMGGTSLDIGLITEGTVPLIREATFARLIFNLPMVAVDSIGQGTGTFIRVDPLTRRIQLGPESAGADPGPVCYDMGNETPTVMDCDLILGIINPDNYLGGKVKLNTEKAYRLFKERVADVLGIDVYDAAEGVVKLCDATMAGAIRAQILSRGYTDIDQYLMTFGGAGPMHMAGFTEGLRFKGVVTMTFAAGFSAFGCATVDYSHRYQKSTHIAIPPGASAEAKMAVAAQLNQVWQELEGRAVESMGKEGFEKKQITLKQVAFVRYGGQLDDVEVFSPMERINRSDDLDALIAKFEDLYAKIFSSGARYPEAGFQILEVAIVSEVPKLKPKIEKKRKGTKVPKAHALKGTRKVYYHGKWHDAQIYEMDELLAGNQIKGISVIEADATTLFVPPGKTVTMDEWGFMWLT